MPDHTTPPSTSQPSALAKRSDANSWSSGIASDALFWSKTAPSYAKAAISDEASYQTKLEMTRQHLTPEMTVLEIGCGTGSTALLHAPYVKHIYATDFSSEMIEIAKSKLAETDITNITFDVAAIEDLHVSGAEFDAILALNVLHLVRDPESAIAACFDLLKPGGVLVASTACIADMSVLIKLGLPVARLVGYAPHVQSFSESALIAWLEGAGFEIAERWSAGKGKALFTVARKA